MSTKHKTLGLILNTTKTNIEQKLKPWGPICTIVFFA